MSKNKLEKLFVIVDNCKENKCKVNNQDIDCIFKPDNGLKDIGLQEKLFGTTIPKLCDCIILKKDIIVLLEIKCGLVTSRILKEIIVQLENVTKILKNQSINFSKVLFIYDRFDNNKLKQQINTKIIGNKRIEYIQFRNEAISI